MVLLTMTAPMVEGLQRLDEATKPGNNAPSTDIKQEEPSLESPVYGNPISHGQVIDLWKKLSNNGFSEYSLEGLLLGARIFVPAPPPKAKPVSDAYFNRVLMYLSDGKYRAPNTRH
jgi:TMEM199 family protein